MLIVNIVYKGLLKKNTHTHLYLIEFKQMNNAGLVFNYKIMNNNNFT